MRTGRTKKTQKEEQQMERDERRVRGWSGISPVERWIDAVRMRDCVSVHVTSETIHSH